MLVIYTNTTWWQSLLLLIIYQIGWHCGWKAAGILYSLCDKSVKASAFTSAKEVCSTWHLSVFLFRLLANSCKNYWLHLHEDFTTGKEEILNFGSHPHPDPILRFKKKKSSTLQDRAFSPQFGWRNWSDLHKIFSTDVSLDKLVHTITCKSSKSKVAIQRQNWIQTKFTSTDIFATSCFCLHI